MSLEALLGLIASYAGIGIAILVGLVLLSRATKWWHRVPPNTMMVVYGRKAKRPKAGTGEGEAETTVISTGVRLATGGGIWVVPVLEEFQVLSLNVMTITAERDRVYTTDGIPVLLDWVAQVQIKPNDISMMNAARSFLGMTLDEIIQVIRETLSANCRAIVGQLTIEELHRDREGFNQKVQKLAADEMDKFGVGMNLGIKDITDESGYFEAMAAPKIAIVKRDAKIAAADADRQAREKAAENKLAAEQAEVNASRAILEQQQSLEMRQVEKNKVVQLAQAASDEEVQKRRALAVQQLKEAEVLVPARADQLAAVIRANATKETAQITAEGQAVAARTSADAAAYVTKQQAAAEAEKVRKEGEAAADAAKAQMNAKAEGTEAQLLAEAKGKAELAKATASEGEVNLREIIARELIAARMKTAESLAQAFASIGANVKLVQIGGNGSGEQGNALMNLLGSLPKEIFEANEVVEALSGASIEDILERVLTMMRTAGKESVTPSDSDASTDEATKKTKK